jgi:hypothetical protein
MWDGRNSDSFYQVAAELDAIGHPERTDIGRDEVRPLCRQYLETDLAKPRA